MYSEHRTSNPACRFGTHGETGWMTSPRTQDTLLCAAGVSGFRQGCGCNFQRVYGPGGGVKMSWVPMRRQMMCGWPGVRSSP
jgi:hypothetical protein